MISHRCRYKGRGSVLMRFFTSSIDRCAAARVILAIPSLFWFQSSPPLFYHSTRIGMRRRRSHIGLTPLPQVLFTGMLLCLAHLLLVAGWQVEVKTALDKGDGLLIDRASRLWPN